MDFTEKTLPPNPYAKANPISKLLFLWILPLFSKGYKKELEGEDLYAVIPNYESKHVGDTLERYWNQELERAKLTGKKPSLFRAIVKMSWKTFLFVAVLFTFNQCVFMIAQPIFLRLLIETFNSSDSKTWKGYTYAGIVCLISFLNTLLHQPGIFQVMKISMKIRVAASSLLYRKSLRLSKAAQRETNSGQIVNLLSNDCTRFDMFNHNFLPYIIIAPIQTSVLMYLMYEQIGPACFAGICFIVLLLPMQYYLGKYSATFRLQIAKKTDERGHFMHEIIIGMRVIKMYAWEKPFSVLIDGIRKLEMIEVKKRGLLLGFHHSVFSLAPKLVQYFTFVVFVQLENEPMTAEKVFFTLACLQTVIKTTVHLAPLAISGIGELTVATNRVQEFLLLDEQNTNNSEQGVLNNNPEKFTDARLSMQNVCASWTGERPTLDNVTFSVEGDKLVVIVGPVGSSKSSLLNAIIDELPVSSGNLSINGTVSYASQEPWIFAGNLRQNILFGLPYDEIHYQETIKACSLEQDLKQLPYGDMTVVGERGVALSGGQKARVNLARALYRKCDIYLLDDPLSAVDTKVSRHLFEKCVREHLRGSIRILVTHQLQYLPQADHIIVLNHGSVLAQGTFEELKKAGIDFVGLIANDGSATTIATQKRQSNAVAEKPEQAENTKPEENVEKKAEGSVTFRTYRDYFMAGHSVFGFISLVLAFLLCQLFTSGNDYWLSFWTNAEAKHATFVTKNATGCIKDPHDKGCDADDTYFGEDIYLYVYTGFAVGVLVFNLWRGLWFYRYCAKISVTVHDRMFRSMVRAPVRFYDDNPSGRIMNRFTKDVGTMDELLPPALIDTCTIFLQVVGVMGVVILSNYYMSVPAAILFIALYFIRKVFIATARDIKRIESIAKSPVFTHVAATIQGLTTIRACKSQSVLIKQFEGHQDMHSSAWFLFIGANRGFGVWLELISDTFLVIVAYSFLVISTSEEGGNVGLAISSILSIMNTFQWGIRQSAETENFMTSVERALEYSKLSPEAELESKPSAKPPANWPKLGQIELNNVSLSYEQDKPVLKNLTFDIKASEKIGIVGRTGAGKSSIIAALFRLTEPEGDIIIDNVAIKEIGLHDLRKSISIIPQDPVLFSGSVRYNLDPFNQFDDGSLWSVIEETELKDAVPSLDYQVDDGGANFSVGQRQLVCLARAILRKNRILVMDEATANVDPGTDQLIQQTIRSKFSDCTIITIAHRLHSIIDCDRILVLDHGQLKEYDNPHVLLQNNAGVFTGMVLQTGESTSAMLRKLAAESQHHLIE